MSWFGRALGLAAAAWVSLGCASVLLTLFEVSWAPGFVHSLMAALETPQGFFVWIGLPTVGCLMFQLQRLRHAQLA